MVFFQKEKKNSHVSYCDLDYIIFGKGHKQQQPSLMDFDQFWQALVKFIL